MPSKLISRRKRRQNLKWSQNFNSIRKRYLQKVLSKKEKHYWLSLEELLDESVDITSTSSFSLLWDFVSIPTPWLLDELMLLFKSEDAGHVKVPAWDDGFCSEKDITVKIFWIKKGPQNNYCMT